MARLPRLIVAGLPHLLSQRAQHGQIMVRDDTDRLGLLRLLAEAARQRGVAIHAYALREHRFDLVATPTEPEGLSTMMQTVARRHAASFNRCHGRQGGLWEGRFRVALLEPESWLLPAMVYVERLPGTAAAGWVSRAAHEGRAVAPALTDPPAYWAFGNTPFEREMNYRAYLERSLTSDQMARIEMALRGGWVLGSEGFAGQQAAASGRPASPRRRGRPRRPSPKLVICPQ